MSAFWRSLLKYPRHLLPVHQDLLDTLSEILPPVDYNDRYVTMGEWIAVAYDRGLLTLRETQNLRFDIANNL